MKEVDWVVLLISVAFIIIATWGLTSSVTFKEGAKTARLYYEATGQFPSEGWLEDNMFKGYDCSEEILESLKPH